MVPETIIGTSMLRSSLTSSMVKVHFGIQGIEKMVSTKRMSEPLHPTRLRLVVCKRYVNHQKLRHGILGHSHRVTFAVLFVSDGTRYETRLVWIFGGEFIGYFTG